MRHYTQKYDFMHNPHMQEYIGCSIKNKKLTQLPVNRKRHHLVNNLDEFPNQR